MEVGKEYKCWFSGRILEFVGWFKEGETPYVKDNYNPGFNGEKGRRTWSLKYLKEATPADIAKYKNDHFNTHKLENVTLQVNEDNTFDLWGPQEDVVHFNLDDLNKIKNICEKGYIKKYE